jgi:hypothetical protein
MTDTPKISEEIAEKAWNSATPQYGQAGQEYDEREFIQAEIVALVESAMAAGKAEGIRQVAHDLRENARYGDTASLTALAIGLDMRAQAYDTGIEKPHEQ